MWFNSGNWDKSFLCPCSLSIQPVYGTYFSSHLELQGRESCSKKQSPNQTPPAPVDSTLPVSKPLQTATAILVQGKETYTRCALCDTNAAENQPRFSEAPPPKVKNTAQAEPHLTTQTSIPDGVRRLMWHTPSYADKSQMCFLGS